MQITNRILTSHSNRVNRPFSYGFSLIEMIVVVAIISIILGIGGTGLMKYMPEYRLKSAARDLISNMQRARIGALKQNNDWALVFDEANSKYMVCSDSGGDNDWATIGDNNIGEESPLV